MLISRLEKKCFRSHTSIFIRKNTTQRTILSKKKNIIKLVTVLVNSTIIANTGKKASLKPVLRI